MAFGDQRGGTGSYRSNNNVTIPANFTVTTLTGSAITVEVNDLIILVVAEQTGGSVTAVTDNLGNVYTALVAGQSTGTVVNERPFYSCVTAAGSLTSVNCTNAGTAHNFSACACAFEGPFERLPLDKNPTSIINDVTSPWLFPATGVLSQAEEMVIGFLCGAISVASTPTSPMVGNASVSDSAGLAGSSILSKVVTSDVTTTPQTTGGTATANVLGLATFKRAKQGRMFSVF